MPLVLQTQKNRFKRQNELSEVTVTKQYLQKLTLDGGKRTKSTTQKFFSVVYPVLNCAGVTLQKLDRFTKRKILCNFRMKKIKGF